MAATGGVLSEKVFLEISQENTCARVSFLIKFAGLMQQVRLWHRCFLVNFAKLLRAPFLQNTSGRQLLDDGDDSVLLDYDRFM